MKKLVRKMLRDILSAKGQFVSIALVTALGVAFFAGLLTVRESLTNNIDSFYHDTNLADVWATYAGADNSAVESVRGINDVSSAEGRLKLDGVSRLDGEDKGFVVYTQTSDISKLYTVEGDLPKNKRECAVNEQFVTANEIEMGDKIPFTLNGETFTFTVSASILSSEYVNAVRDNAMVAPDYKNFGLVYLHPDMIQELSGGFYNEVLITTVPESNAEDIFDKLTQTNGYIYSYPRERHLSYSVIAFKVASIDKISKILPILFFLVAAALIFISMSRLVASQRGQIGVMKALGTSKAAMLWHYLLFPVITGVIGGIVGGALGATVVPVFVLNMFATYFALPPLTLYGGIAYAVIGIVLSVAFGTAAAYLSCRSMLKATAARLMRSDPPKNARKIWLEKRKGLWKRLSFKTKLVWRNVLLNKRRAVLGSVGVIGGCALILAAVGLQGTLDYAMSDLYEGTQTYDIQVTLDSPLPYGNGVDFKSGEIQNAAATTKLPVIVNPQDTAANSYINALPSKSEAIRLFDTNGEQITLDSGIVITEKLAKTNHIQKGDTVTLAIMNGNQAVNAEFEVSDICRSYISQGVHVSYEALERQNVSVPIYGYYITLAPGAEASQLAESIEEMDGVNAVLLKEDIEASTTDAMGILTMFVAIMFLASAVLTLAVIFNITSINLFERRRDIATLRVLGSLLKEVNRLILTENLIVTAFGSVIGVLVGFVMQYGVIHAVGSDEMDLPFRFVGSSIPIAVVCVFLFTFAVNFLLRKRIKSIDMVESLKSVE
jgi:putative ABC transport system permease protein